ncbi:MAG TPA: response regulator transcription factor [Candidatus Saccharimonadales bacterium]|nr:response regulator transcription factor [Candidatus Saccharimonadales bacterium]
MLGEVTPGTLTMKILYIDDNRLLSNSVKRLLSATYTVDLIGTGAEGIEKACSISYNLIILDLGLPDMSGHDVCRKLRKCGITVPILIVTIQKDPASTAQLLNGGADDYITKPFNGAVLCARIAALLRRSQEMHEEKIITIDDLTVNVTRRRVWRANQEITLRRKEFDILEYLMTNKGRVLTRIMIFDHVWEADSGYWNNTVDVHIKHLRDKVDRPFKRLLIKTAHGVGYMIDDAS